MKEPGSGRKWHPEFDLESTVTLDAEAVHEGRFDFTDWPDGPLAHLTRLRIPRFANPNGFTHSVKGYKFSDFVSMNVYSDSLAGVSGSNNDTDPVAAHVVMSGETRWSGKSGDFSVGKGQMCIRDTRIPLNFMSAPATRTRVVKIPRDFVTTHAVQGKRARVLNEPMIVDCDLPQVQFFLNFLESIEKSRDVLRESPDVQKLALESCAAVFSGILSGRTDTGAGVEGASLVGAAKAAIEKNLDQQELSPVMIAKSLGVSLRTLHRSFAESGDSPMAFARRRRLQKAHDELMRPGTADRISEIAARWQYSDAAHFIRHFKSHYGVTPAVYARSNKT
ncbi:helix-turn-helix domain-containing protein [Streptomyces sp. NPDC000618]|uniref:helix-turn-helix domain-containing protein n=1 Tax=Streptomyces sp. NPDC000618 TaxID=3154265 RepID=UPI003320E934